MVFLLRIRWLGLGVLLGILEFPKAVSSHKLKPCVILGLDPRISLQNRDSLVKLGDDIVGNSRIL